jgi:hypothetical protein
VRLTSGQLKERYLMDGLPAELADLLVSLDLETARGSEEQLRSEAVHELTGSLPQSLHDWVKENKVTWE